MKRFIALAFSIFFMQMLYAQNESFVDSIRIAYNIPELNYAILSSTEILEIKALGYKKLHSNNKAELSDRFRIGSNTKTITSYIAALLVKEGKLTWQTKFFDLYPQLKSTSDTAYYHITLQDLVTFRANLITWTYTNNQPSQETISGTETEQRYKFAKWILAQQPPSPGQDIYWSNPSYVLAGLMLEKAAQKDYKTLVKEFGKKLNIDFEFGQPNFKKANQTWGHNAELAPEKPVDNYKLNWLCAAGNINVDLLSYSKFIQLQLQGLEGKSVDFTEAEFYKMHYGLPEFSYGWYLYTDSATGLKYSFHKGNPGTFLTEVFLSKEKDRAFIFFMNVQSEAAEEAMTILFEKLNKIYSK